tara:strand:- start:116 stop:796 length:681 start_codon:yes stop_codon:yes gene_type:complete
MNIYTLLKLLGLIIIVLTSIILPLSLLESSIADLTNEFIEWSGTNQFLNSILIIFALAADVFLPIPNGVTNTFAGAILGFYLSIPVIWIGLTLGSIIGFAIGKYAAKPLAKKILSQEDLERSEEVSKKFGVSILLIARPAPALAEISTVAAGLAGMKWSTFLTIMIVSNLLIAVVYAFIGTAALTSQSASIALIGIAVIPFLFWLFSKKIFLKFNVYCFDGLHNPS